MKVLVVKKNTNLEWYGVVIKEQVGRGNLPQSDLDRLTKSHEEHYQTLALLREAMAQYKITAIEVSREDPWPTEKGFAAVFTVGGDGTLLAASRNIVDQTPMIGIKSSATSVGYLCAAEQRSIPSFVKACAEGTLQPRTVARACGEVKFVRDNRTVVTVPVLNDMLFCNTNPAATTRYRIHYGSASERQRSSGVWISTATGSTAAIYAAGGQVLNPEAKNFQYFVREIIRGENTPYQFTGGVFDPDQIHFEIENRNDIGLLALDGQHGQIVLSLGDRVRILRGPELRLVGRTK